MYIVLTDHCRAKSSRKYNRLALDDKPGIECADVTIHSGIFNTLLYLLYRTYHKMNGLHVLVILYRCVIFTFLSIIN